MGDSVGVGGCPRAVEDGDGCRTVMGDSVGVGGCPETGNSVEDDCS